MIEKSHSVPARGWSAIFFAGTSQICGLDRPVNEKRIQSTLYDFLTRRGLKLACPNYTPAGWWECDLFAVTDSDYFVEYEIKISRSDFFNDAKKEDQSRASRVLQRQGLPAPTKHTKLASKDVVGPSRFFFVTPAGMLKDEEIPEWAGLIEISDSGSRLRASIKKPAPQLHREKVKPEVVQHCQSVFYYRFWNLREKIWSCWNK